MKLTYLALAIGTLLSASALAQTTQETIQRDVNQEKRIEQGLKSGELTTKEAGKLEREEARVDKMESKALSDGKLTDAERKRIQREQNKVSNDIYREKHDGQTADPNSASSKRMQADVQRNINQQERIEQGVQSGELTKKEAGNLERGQARIDRKEANAAANGHISAAEQRNIQHAENNQSKKIHREKHNRRQD
jgi:uncharacterized membrane protein YebE (DUF533 family)